MKIGMRDREGGFFLSPPGYGRRGGRGTSRQVSLPLKQSLYPLCKCKTE